MHCTDADNFKYHKIACDKRNTTLRCRTKTGIAFSLVKPGELTHRVSSQKSNTLLRSAPSCSIPILLK